MRASEEGKLWKNDGTPASSVRSPSISRVVGRPVQRERALLGDDDDGRRITTAADAARRQR